MTPSALAWLGKNSVDGRLGKALGPLSERLMQRDFSRAADIRVQVYFHREQISFAQIYPLLAYAQSILRSHGAEIRFAPVEPLLAGETSPPDADVVIVQPWFTVAEDVLRVTLDRLRVALPDAPIHFFDSYAHNDLRFARTVAPFLTSYVKKSLFRTRADYFRPTLGHTNLTDFYGWQYDVPEPRTDWQVPAEILPKLRLCPGFFTAPGLMEGFLGAPPDFEAERPIDLHARIGTTGTPWYAAMREDCLTRARELPVRVRTGTGLTREAFLAELGTSKLAFSPFGYGELCWRDIEGFLTGAVVVKQDMGHLETLPDLFRPWETYIPVAWDLADLEVQVSRALADDGLRKRIARSAWLAVRRYLAEERFVDDMGFLFRQPDRGAVLPAAAIHAMAASA